MDTNRIRLLLVEDDDMDAELFLRALRPARGDPYAVDRARRLDAAVDVLMGTRADCVLLDLGLPDSQGIETLLGLRARHPDVPVVVLTGLADESIGHRAVEAGAQDFLAKDHLDGQSLARSIRYAIERDRAQKRIAEGLREVARLADEGHRRDVRLQEARWESLAQMASGIAHDFNNILAIILGHAELALDEPALPPEARKAIETVKTAAMRASALSHRMLDFAACGKMTVQPVDLSTIIREVAEPVCSQMSRKISLHMKLAGGLAAVDADPGRVRMVFIYLLTNAFEAIGDASGAIVLTTGMMTADETYLQDTVPASLALPGTYVYFEVADDAQGMDATTLTKIFDPFFSTKFAGRGLGLACALGIVKAHNGCIKVTSEPGRGATFRVLFPRSKSAVAVGNPAPIMPVDPAEPGQNPVTPEQGNPLRSRLDPQAGTARSSGLVLVVDDEPEIRHLAKMALEQAGFQVLTAQDGQEAVDIFRKRAREISLVLLDLTMPVLDGKLALREIRRIRQDARVILCSGYHKDSAPDTLEAIGEAPFLKKPFGRQTLLNAVHATLGITNRQG